LDAFERTMMVQTARTSVNSRRFVSEPWVFHKDFHSFCEQRVTDGGDVT